MVQNSIKKQILATILILIATILIFEFSDYDILVQNYFYRNNSWIIDRNNSLLKFIFYDGLKKLIILFFIMIFLSLFFLKKPFIENNKKILIIILLSGILIPSIVGILKASTNMPCPRNLSYFGNNYPSVGLFEHYPKNFIQPKKIKCWPAGHASGGFSLMSLILLFKSRKNKTIALLPILVIAWSMSLYKMAIGDHFLSHSIITMIISWLVILILIMLSAVNKDFSFKKITKNSTNHHILKDL